MGPVRAKKILNESSMKRYSPENSVEWKSQEYSEVEVTEAGGMNDDIRVLRFTRFLSGTDFIVNNWYGWSFALR